MTLFSATAFTLLGLLILTATSCNNKKTYSDYLKEEKRAIDLLIAKNNFVILKDFPANSLFAANEFYKDPYTGVYFSIIERGDSIAPQWREQIFIRFRGLHYFKNDDTIRYSNHQSINPETLEYIGPVSSATRDSYENAGWVVPLSYVGHGGKVKMIIPFDFGSSTDRSLNEPTYYEQVEYRFGSQW